MLTNPTNPSSPRSRFAEPLLVIGMLCTMGAIVAPQLAPAGEDPLAELTRSQVEWLQSSIERFRGSSNDRSYPDLSNVGWQPLIELGILSEEPVNPITGRTAVRDTPSPGAGWHYDRYTGRIGACYFDERSCRITPQTP